MRKIINEFPFLRRLLRSIRHRLWVNRTKANLKTYLSTNSCPKLQLGAGANLLPGWFNTDYFPRPNIFFVDVTKPFPIPSDSFNFIFTEHHIEHISYKHAVFMLKESFRILKPGGIIKVATPDLTKSLASYFNDDIYQEEFKDHSKNYIYSGFYNAVNYVPVDDYFKAHEINDMFYNYEHKFIYDFESLKRVLENAGFTNVKDCALEASTHSDLLDIEAHNSDFDKYFTLSVEATKNL